MQGLPATVEDPAAAVESLARALVGRMHGACTELDRVDELLGHAIRQLMEVFTDIHAQLQARHEEFTAVMAQGDGLELVARDARQAVMALQFRDVVGQKLGHVRLELATLEQGLTEFCAASYAGPPAALVPRIERLLHGLDGSRAPTPVRQEQMHAGAVDLF